MNIRDIKPNPGYVLVEPADRETRTESGFYLPEGEGEKPEYGTVLAVGEDWVTEQGAVIHCPVSVDQVVFYKKWGGNEVKVEDKDYQFLRFSDVLAVIEEK